MPRPSGPRPPVHRTGRLTDIDARDVTSLLRTTIWFAPVCILVLSFFWYSLWINGTISGAQFGVLLVVDFPLAGLGVLLINSYGSRFGSGAVSTIPAAGDRPSGPVYPRQEILIGRGEYREAAGYFRDHLVVEPNDHEARLRLAFLLETRLDDDAGAETLYKEVQAGNPAPREDAAATMGLIDLYRRTGRRDRLIVQLARFADRYRGSAAAEGARRELTELKGGDTPTGS